MKPSLPLALALALAPLTVRAQNWMHYPLERSAAARVRLTQGFYGDYVSYCGSRDGCGTHNGYDIGAPVGTPVYAVAPGVVDAINAADTRTADYGNAGLWVRVRHDGGTVPGLGATYFVGYLHLSRIDVSVGAAVSTTTRLGLSGNTGGVGPHLHLHLATARNYCGAPVDPGCPTPAYVSGSVVSPAFVDAPGCQSVCRPVTIQWLQPAAYGGEPYARTPPPVCGSLDYRGRCEGETLRWCMNGAPMEAECLSRGGVCAWQNDSEGFNCLRCDPALNRPLLPGPRCEGTRFLRCDGTTPVSEDCAATGRSCTPDGCVAPPPLDAGAPDDVGTPDIDVGSPVDVAAPSDIAADRPARDLGVSDASGDVADGATPSGGLEGGCGCRAVGATGSPRAAFGLVLLALARRRRRR
ncbi:MAG: M23 family metallopeptidase [Polyangiales bacterium]